MDGQEIFASVQKLLEEIHLLKVEKDGSETTNPAKAAYHQGQILRTFAKIDSLLGPYADSEAIDEMRDAVWLKRKELNAELDDLKTLPVPKLLKSGVLEEWKEDKRNKEEPLAYLYLPPEVRRNILGYLTCPSDMLNLFKGIPGDGEMMEWSLNSLQLELVLPILYAQKYGLTYDDTVNLCRANPDLHNAVRNCFERNLLRVSDINRRTTLVGGGEKNLREISASDFTLNPVPVTVNLCFQLLERTPHRQSVAEQLETLRQVGANIWSLSLEIVVGKLVSTREALQFIRDTLALTPNLRSLFFDFENFKMREDEDVEAFQDIELPELSQLRTMEFSGAERPSPVVQEKLLEKYRPLIQRLEITSKSFYRLLSDGNGEPGNAQLTHLKATLYNFEDYIIDEVEALETFCGAPLQSIYLDMWHDTNDADNLRTILCFLNRFGNTLEHVEVHFSHSDKFRHEPTDTDLDWLAHLNFPKVKTLKVEGYPITWSFLLYFPALETLTLEEDWDPDDEEDNFLESRSRYFDSSDILELSLNEEDMWSSNVWKLFPFLKTIDIGGWNKKHFQVTRTQCLALQRRLAKVMQAFGPVHSTVTGSFQTIVQAEDHGLVVDGNINGDVIQKGNGSILVNGIVKGKIDQRGDGKIFIRGKHTGKVFQTGNGTVQMDWGNVKNLKVVSSKKLY